jgi:uncharacterized membrane protein
MLAFTVDLAETAATAVAVMPREQPVVAVAVWAVVPAAMAQTAGLHLLEPVVDEVAMVVLCESLLIHLLP